ncbi:MAG: adenylate kinase [Lachnospirales bacterium]
MNIIVVGPPGAGKGTQSKVITKEFNIPHVSTGDLLRDEVKKGTELGNTIKNLMNSGGLVSDEQVTELLVNRMKEDDCKNGILLDGYPRTIEQAKSLDTILSKIDKVVVIEIEDEKIVDRMSGRRTCPSCQKLYHMTNQPPKNGELCDDCNIELNQRADDNPETVKNRLVKYHQVTSPIIDFYKERGIVFSVYGDGDIKEISSKIIKAIKE